MKIKALALSRCYCQTCAKLFFHLCKVWHRFLSEFGSILTNLCQTCANPWHGFLQARQWGRAKVVPRLSTINEETCANANLYI